MGDVREPALAGLAALIETLAQAVHVMNQLAQLVAALAGQPRLVLALAQAPGMAGEGGHRRHQVARQQPGHQQRQHQADHRHGRHEAQQALLEAAVQLVADRLLIRVGQPAHQVAAGVDRHPLAQARGRRRTQQRALVRGQQGEVAGRVRALALAALAACLAVPGQPVQPAQQAWLLKQETPAAALGVEHAQVLRQALHLGLLALVDVFAEAALEGEEKEPAGRQDQNQEGGQEGHEEFVADAHGGGGLTGSEAPVYGPGAGGPSVLHILSKSRGRRCRPIQDAGCRMQGTARRKGRRDG